MYQINLLNLNRPILSMLENSMDLDYHIYKSYQIICQVGKGTYGLVYKVKHKKTHQLFAIKKICDAYQNIIDAKRTYRQLNYLLQLSHPCIVKLYHIIPGNIKATSNNQSNTSRIQSNFLNINSPYQNTLGYITEKPYQHYSSNNKNKHVYAIFQYVESDLAKALKNCTLQSIQRKFITYQILHGLSYLHKSKLIHRDIKPSNILIDSNCAIKICDFGLCRLKQDFSDQKDKNIITEYVASRWYRPPQILLGFSPCNEAIDMWSTGCLMAELIMKTPLFQGTSTMDQLQKIFRVIGLPKEQEINNFQTDQAKFLIKTFTFSRKNKPQKLNEVLHEACDQQIDLIQNLLQFNGSKRLSADQALTHPYFKEIEDMNYYNFQSYNHPVKIIDSSIPSTLIGDLKNFGQNNQKMSQIQKKKELTLEQYQVLIQELERATSRSSNRGFQQMLKYNNQGDRVLENSNSKRSQEEYHKEKSTRQSNFLYEHKLMDMKYKIKQESQKNQPYYNEFIQNQETSYNENNSSNINRSNDHFNYQKSSIQYEQHLVNRKPEKTMKTYQNQGFSYHYQKNSSSMEQDLQQNYKTYFNNKKIINQTKGHTKQASQNIKQTQKQKDKTQKQKSKNKSVKSTKSINNKSNSKISVESRKQKSKKPLPQNLKQKIKDKEGTQSSKFLSTNGIIIDDKKNVTNLVSKKSKQRKVSNNLSKNKVQIKGQTRTLENGFAHQRQSEKLKNVQKTQKIENSSMINLSQSSKLYSPPLPQKKQPAQNHYHHQSNMSMHITSKNKSNQNVKSRSKSKQSLHSTKNNTSYKFVGNRQNQSSLSTHTFTTTTNACHQKIKEHKVQFDKFKKFKGESVQKKSKSKNKNEASKLIKK